LQEKHNDILEKGWKKMNWTAYSIIRDKIWSILWWTRLLQRGFKRF